MNATAGTGAPATPRRWRRLAAEGVFWRHYLDWAAAEVPFFLKPLNLAFMTSFFLLFAAPPRRALLANLRAIYRTPFPLLRAWRTFYNYAAGLGDASFYRQFRRSFTYELDGSEHLQALAAVPAAIVLTAHMGNYDLGAAIFTRKFGRSLRVVRAPELDQESARHTQEALEHSADQAVKVDYNTDSMLSFDLLAALRGGEVVSIQGDRAPAGMPSSETILFGRPFRVPSGPFALAFVTETPIYPLFTLRTGYRCYRILALPPIRLSRAEGPRDEQIAAAVARWAAELQRVIREFPNQWFAFVPLFSADGNHSG